MGFESRIDSAIAHNLKLAKLEGQGTVFMVYPVMTVEAGGRSPLTGWAVHNLLAPQRVGLRGWLCSSG